MHITAIITIVVLLAIVTCQAIRLDEYRRDGEAYDQWRANYLHELEAWADQVVVATRAHYDAEFGAWHARKKEELAQAWERLARECDEDAGRVVLPLSTVFRN